MQKIRAAVIGVGYLGRFHAQKYAQAAGCELVAVADSRPEAREPLAAELKTRAVSDHRQPPARPAIARDFLEAGAHVLVEKPITDTPAQARELIGLAARVKRILQVGHLERFNAAVLAAEPHLRSAPLVDC